MKPNATVMVCVRKAEKPHTILCQERKFGRMRFVLEMTAYHRKITLKPMQFVKTVKKGVV